MMEFLVFVGVAISLFLGILYLGKFHDIQAHTIQAARYAAWERTVHDNANFSDTKLEGQIRARIFSWNQNTYKAADMKSNGQSWGRQTAFWTDHVDKQRLIDKPKDVTVATAAAALPGTAAAAIANSIGALDKTVGKLTGGEALNQGGLYTSTVNVKLNNIAALPAPLNQLNLTLKETSSLVTDSWDADGSRQTAMRTRAYTPASALQNISSLLSVVDGFLAILEPSFSKFKPGQICPDIVPADRLSGSSVLPVYQGGGPCY
ncbi:hypothetical protein H8K38_11290 [Undibacterium sp. FT79W]|uniref:hypothetical protein n=1 Tax=Undibacterium sp. FT79W TaxID=2762296 RepID=UPI00164C3613|nr:hypothetical protein [Undibacterium sp. FT79W]MBC3878398.1 hypothetical protein [Undibacterium sp. FT79W]